MSVHDFDIGIIGGGPAGSAVASYLSKGGLSCVLFEKEVFPREHVGESLVPSTTRVFRDIGFLEQMEEHKFPRKYGAAWTTAFSEAEFEHDWGDIDIDDQVDIRFAEREQAGVNQDYTYHVDRGKFDHLLLQHAAKLGTNVCEGVAVAGVDFEDDRVVVRHHQGGDIQNTSVRMIVDASGRRTLVGNQLKLRVPDPVFDQYALHTWFEGYDRGDSDKADYIWIHFLPITNSWIWQIPITDTITSFGVVTQKKNFSNAKSDFESFFWNCVSSRPEIREKLKRANQLRPLKPEADYSYAMQQIAGDRFVLVGDAARFVDPIFSSGVSIALNSARHASRAILSAAEQGDFSASQFRAFSDTMRNGCTHWYEFIRLYYRLNIMFTFFVRDPEHRMDVLRLLQGDAWDAEEPAVLGAMRDVVAEVEENEDHIWHNLLGDLTSNAFRPAF